MALSSWIQSVWYRQQPAPFYLRWLVPLYRLLNHWDRRRQHRDQAHPGVPVIIVGNLTVGGTGKTPMVIWLAEYLQQRGYSPGIVTRGYAAQSTSSSPVIIDTLTTAADAGDEPHMMHRRLGIPVCIGADRSAAARKLVGEAAVDVIISDDGLQHLRLARDVQICVIDGNRGFGNGSLLPAGPLRRPPSDLDQVDLVICSHRLPENAGPAFTSGRLSDRVHVMCYEVANAWNLADSSQRMPLCDFQSLPGRTVHAVAGIGNPSQFFDMLQKNGVGHEKLEFSDHHQYQASELAHLKQACVLMTEKDAVKCLGFCGDDWWAVPVTAQLPDAASDAIDVLMARVIKRLQEKAG